MSQSKYKQDLPPPGGYKPIQYLRVPAKTYFSGLTMFLGMAGFQLFTCYLFTKSAARAQRFEVEERSSRIAMLPMLLAEKERLYLKRLRQNRDEEARLMKDVPGWKVGTYYGEPIYHTRPADEWHDVTLNEYYAHNSNMDLQYAYNFYKWL